MLLTTMAGIFLLAALADLLDGAVARVMKAESEFGGIFDSLSDAISFGVAPVVVILKSAATTTGQPYLVLTASGAMVFSVCGILRLARYNVLALQSKKSEVFDETFNKNFTGLPIPAAATAAVSMNLLLFSDEFRSFWAISHEVKTIILFIVMILLGYFMISPWKFPSMKNLHIRVASFQAVFLNRHSYSPCVLWSNVSICLCFLCSFMALYYYCRCSVSDTHNFRPKIQDLRGF